MASAIAHEWVAEPALGLTVNQVASLWHDLKGRVEAHEDPSSWKVPTGAYPTPLPVELIDDPSSIYCTRKAGGSKTRFASALRQRLGDSLCLWVKIRPADAVPPIVDVTNRTFRQIPMALKEHVRWLLEQQQPSLGVQKTYFLHVFERLVRNVRLPLKSRAKQRAEKANQQQQQPVSIEPNDGAVQLPPPVAAAAAASHSVNNGGGGEFRAEIADAGGSIHDDNNDLGGGGFDDDQAEANYPDLEHKYESDPPEAEQEEEGEIAEERPPRRQRLEMQQQQEEDGSEQQWEFERIVAEAQENGEKFYKVRWKDSWVSAQNFNSPLGIEALERWNKQKASSRKRQRRQRYS